MAPGIVELSAAAGEASTSPSSTAIVAGTGPAPPAAGELSESDVMAELDAAADRIAEVLAGGQLVVAPTDTVLGVMASPQVDGATALLTKAKGRPPTMPLMVLVDSVGTGLDLAGPTPAWVGSLLAACWPGALSIIAPRAPGLGWELGDPSTTIGMRWPAHRLIEAVVSRVGPVAASSANRHGHAVHEDPLRAAQDLLEPVGLVVTGGVPALLGGSLSGPESPRSATASTILDVCDPTPSLVRQGSVSEERLVAAGAPLGLGTRLGAASQ